MTTLARSLALTTAGALTVGLVGLAPAPASAAFATVSTVHGAKLKACKGTSAGEPTIKFRLDNRDGRHRHRGGLIRTNGGATRVVQVVARAGRVSTTKAVVVRPGDRFDTLVGEVDGPTAGGGISRSDLPRC